MCIALIGNQNTEIKTDKTLAEFLCNDGTISDVGAISSVSAISAGSAISTVRGIISILIGSRYLHWNY